MLKMLALFFGIFSDMTITSDVYASDGIMGNTNNNSGENGVKVVYCSWLLPHNKTQQNLVESLGEINIIYA